MSLETGGTDDSVLLTQGLERALEVLTQHQVEGGRVAMRERKLVMCVFLR